MSVIMIFKRNCELTVGRAERGTEKIIVEAVQLLRRCLVGSELLIIKVNMSLIAAKVVSSCGRISIFQGSYFNKCSDRSMVEDFPPF